MATFATRLKSMRKEFDMTQDDLAKLLKIRRATISAYETGKIQPPYEKIKFLASHFGVSTSYLTGESSIRTFENPSIDISDTLKKLLSNLRDSNQELLLNGKPLDDKSRNMLKNSIESVLSMIDILTDK